MRVMVAITNDQLIKQISYQDIEIPNDQLFNGILLAFNYISKDIKRMYRPYMCETEYELFESLEELQDHNQAVHNQIKLPEDIDAYTKHRYEMIAPLINMHHRTEDMVIRRSKMYDSSPSAIYRCLKEYDNYGIDGLKCHYSERGRKKIFDGEVIRKIVSKHIKCECNCCDNRSTIINQYAKITEECLNIGIPIPSFSTIYRMKGEIFRSSTQ